MAEYKPNKAAQEILTLIKSDWREAWQIRHRPYRHLNNRSLSQFWQESRDHYNGYTPPISSVDDDWKSRAFKKKTRHKVLATVAQFISSGVGIDYSAVNSQNSLDRAVSKMADDLYNWSTIDENFDYKLLQYYMEMIISGTVHVLDEIVWDTREVKEILDIDFETGMVKYKTVTRTDRKGVVSSLIPNEEIYIRNAWTFDIQEQPSLMRRRITTMEAGAPLLQKYSNWKFVEGGITHFLPVADENGPEGEEENVEDNSLEIITYWNRDKDLMQYVANGVLLTQPDNPIPYPHKNYPIAKGVFETTGDQRFYYGDSLPNKNYDDQTLTNDLWRLFIDSTKLKNKPPLFTNNIELAGTDLIVPGTIATKEFGDEIETIRDLTQGVSNSEYNMLTLAERQVDENTVDPLVAGRSPQGDPTATEIRTVAGFAERVKSVNQQFIGGFLVDHANLRLENVLWFLMNDDDVREAVLNDVRTSSDKTGRRIIRFLEVNSIPSSAEILKAETKLEKQGRPTDFIFADREGMKDYRFHAAVSAIPNHRRTSQAKIAEAVQKYQLYAPNPFVDQQSNTRRLINGLGDDADELMKKESPAAPTIGLPTTDTALSASVSESLRPPGI